MSNLHSPTHPLRLTKAHCLLVLYTNMLESVARLQASGSLGAPGAQVLRQLACLFALTQLEGCLGDLLEDGYMTGGCKQRVYESLRE
jgi:hypothetical protein